MRRAKWLLLALSLPYLLTELAFTSRLIDFLGDRPTNDQITEIEHIGRTLTGVALALWLLPLFLRRITPGPRWLPVWSVLALLLCGGVIVVCAYASRHFIERVVVALTDRTDAAQRRRALLSQVAIRHMKGEQPLLLMNNQRLPDELRKTLEGKVVLAGLPFLLANITDIEGQLTEVLERVLSGDIRERMGSEEKLYNDTFVRLMQEGMAPLYEGYVRINNERAKALHGVTARADAEWENYVGELRRRGLSAYTVAITPRLRQRASEELRGRVLEAPAGWVPEKPSDFDPLMNDEIEKKYRDAMTKLGLSPSLASNLSFPEFLEQRDIRTLWSDKTRAAISDRELADTVATFGPRAGRSEDIFPAFTRDVYGNILNRSLAQESARLRASIAEYAGQSELAADAYQAMKVVVVIPLAIFLSIAGALGHLGKVTWLGATAAGLPRLAAAFLVLSIIAVPVTLAFRLAPPVGERPEIRRMLVELSSKLPPGNVSQALLKATINLQAYAYPVGSALAAFPPIKTLLRGSR